MGISAADCNGRWVGKAIGPAKVDWARGLSAVGLARVGQKSDSVGGMLARYARSGDDGWV